MAKPRISILTPVINVEKYIGETIQSVLSQSYKDWEMIIMDGASKDRTVEIAKSYAVKHPNIRVYSEKDEGSWHAFDKMFDLAEGEYITNLCGQDGFLDRDWLKACIEVFDRDPEVALVWGLAQSMTLDGKLIQETHISYSQFMEKQGPLTGLKNLISKGLNVAHDLIFAGAQRRKFLLQKLFSRSSALRLSLLASRNFKGGHIPQKQEWFDYWLKTGLVFPDQSMIVSKKVWLDCIPRYQLGRPTVGYLMDFFYDINTRGYLSYYLPVFAMYSRIHPGASGERAGEELHTSFLAYLERVSDFNKKLKREHGTIMFHNRDGKEIGSRTY
ncbi:MAG: glycosyltransferase [Candidatus Liptonbacteria bacterium]